MKVQIRKGVFETNSSSVHAICIATEDEYKVSDELFFDWGNFGWEWETYDNTYERASYLWTAINNFYWRKEQYEEIESAKNRITEVLAKHGCKAKFAEPDTSKYHETGCLDHAGELGEFLEYVLKDEEGLLSYLFSDLSFIETGNDNDSDEDHYVNADVSYPHEEFYKGN